MEIETTGVPPFLPEKGEQISNRISPPLSQLLQLGVRKELVHVIQGASTGKIGVLDLPQPVTVKVGKVDLAHTTQDGTIIINPPRMDKYMSERFKGNKKKAGHAIHKVLEEELLHAVHQSCPGFTTSTKLIGQAALEGDMLPLQAVTTALSLYKRCQGAQERLSAGTVLVNPQLLQQGFGEMLRMSAQFHVTGETTEMAIKPWTSDQQQQLEQIANNSISRWHNQLDSGRFGMRTRNQYRLLCQVLKASQATPEKHEKNTK